MFVGFGEQAVPSIAEFLISPRPLLFSGRDVWVRHMNDACLGTVVISAEKRSACAHAHVRSRDRDVRIPREIIGGVGAVGLEVGGLVIRRNPPLRALGVIDSVVVSAAERKRAHRPLGMVGDKRHIWREK